MKEVVFTELLELVEDKFGLSIFLGPIRIILLSSINRADLLPI